MKGSIFFSDVSGTCTYLSFRDFLRLLVLLVLDELTAIFI